VLGTKLGILNKQYNIITDGLMLNYAPGFINSYPGSGTAVTNIKGEGPNGTLANGVVWSAPSGNDGGYFTFDGSDDKISSADDAALDITSVTLQCWLNLNGTWGGNYPTVFGRLGGASSSYKIRTYGGIGSDIGLQIYDSTYRQGPKLTTGASGDLNYNTWYFLSFSYDYNASDGNRFKVYLNGAFDSQSTKGGGTIAADTQGLEFMNSAADGDSNLGGSLGPCMIYNRELTAGEVLQNYNAGKDMYTN
jgi:hypothetical protein